MVPIWAALLAVFLSVFYMMADVGDKTKNKLQADANRWAIDMLAYAECAENYYKENTVGGGGSATVTDLAGNAFDGTPYCPVGYTPTDLWGNVIDGQKRVFVYPKNVSVRDSLVAIGQIKRISDDASFLHYGTKMPTTGKFIDSQNGEETLIDVPNVVPDGAGVILFEGI